MIRVFCLDDSCGYFFSARTAYEAMQKMKYTLDLSHKDDGAVINKTESGRCLWMEHGGKMYSVVI